MNEILQIICYETVVVWFGYYLYIRLEGLTKASKTFSQGHDYKTTLKGTENITYLVTTFNYFMKIDIYVVVKQNFVSIKVF
jgi:hypothetical protein